MNRKYYSSMISRFYIEYKDKSKIPYYIKKLKQIWDKKDILIIEGEKSRLGIGNDLFNNSKSIKRILCPAVNAFNVYDKILNQARKIDKSILILLALGPTSTVLAYDLHKLGYQVIDVGHIDIEYEWFLKNATKKIQIKNKYVNEVYGNKFKIGNVKDKNYYNEIISKILY
jgi:glycosyltransferase family protein